jgi:hypothetical protein
MDLDVDLDWAKKEEEKKARATLHSLRSVVMGVIYEELSFMG